MAEAIDITELGELLRRVRKQRGLTLKDVFDETGIKIPTLSRIERGSCQEIKSTTLVTLTAWLGVPLERLVENPPKATFSKKKREDTPEVVELHLRADPNLDKGTATILAKMFRAAYEQALNEQPKKR